MCLLLETPEAAILLDEILNVPGIDMIHIGLNDLHLAMGMKFMFQLLTDGIVEQLANKIRAKGIPFGFGGIASLHGGALPGAYVLKEHYRLGSSMVIVGRSFCNTNVITDLDEVRRIFNSGIAEIRELENEAQRAVDYFSKNHKHVVDVVDKIVKEKNNNDMIINANVIDALRKEYGDAFYLLDSEQFRNNFLELRDAFRSIYPNFNIAYSYKTNYTPKFCKIVNELGGYAEVVSEMELEIALRVGVEPNRIIWNGPIKMQRS